MKLLKAIWEAIKSAFTADMGSKSQQQVGSGQVVQKPTLLKSTTKNPNFFELANVVSLDQDSTKIAYIADVCAKINKNKERYLHVQDMTAVPWDLIAAIHFKEASMNFDCMLHNGEPLNIKSRIVPIGVGPFKNWEDSALDSLKRQGALSVQGWSFAKQLEFAESYNGKGYRSHGIYSPYVFAFTNLSEEKGGYPKDHVWDANKEIKRPGVAAILLYLRK